MNWNNFDGDSMSAQLLGTLTGVLIVIVILVLIKLIR
jgi:hypothetical protein